MSGSVTCATNCTTGVPAYTNFYQADYIVQEAAHEGLTALPILLEYGAPASVAVGAPATGTAAGTFNSAANYAAYCTASAAHIASAYPWVHAVELMNEPNNTGFSTLTAAQASSYAQACYAAVKAAAPGLEVVGPALENSPNSGVTYLAAMYAAGCKLGVCFDALSMHPYEFSNLADGAWITTYKGYQAVATANGDRWSDGGPVHVWLTEFSSPSLALGLQGSAAAMSSYFNGCRADYTVDSCLWDYAYVDSPDSDNYLSSRLFLSDFSAKAPMLQTFQGFASTIGVNSAAFPSGVPLYGPYGTSLPLPYNDYAPLPEPT
jgi:hypothetical protein